MQKAAPLRIAQLRKERPELAKYDDQLLIDAFCIDLVHGAAYAWVYLLKSGASSDHARAILAPQHLHWGLEVGDMYLTAERAMSNAGIYRHAEHTIPDQPKPVT